MIWYKGVFDMNARRFLIAMVLMGATGANADIDGMRPTEINGYVLAEAQYLPFQGSAVFRYPGDALFGFTPETATAAAKACAYTSFTRLLQIFLQNPSYLSAAAEVGATRRFVLWINDYTMSNKRTFYRPASFWHTGASARDYKQGKWVWEATQSFSGHCEQPTELQLKLARGDAVRTLSLSHDSD